VLVAQDDSPIRDDIRHITHWDAEWSPDLPEERLEFELIAVAVDPYGVRSLSEPVARGIGGGQGGGGR